jgi:hypothetical protein
MAAITPKPETKVTIGGQQFVLVFDIGDNPTKRGIKMKFVPMAQGIDVRALADIASKISLVLQKRLAPHGLIVDRDTEIKDPMIIGFFIPLEPIADFIVSKLKTSNVAAPQAQQAPQKPEEPQLPELQA